VFTSDIGERSSVLINEAAGVLVKAGTSTALARRIVDILKIMMKKKNHIAKM
jgi:hypothetical protein